MAKTIEFNQKCKSCGGTGVRVAMGERYGSAVVCARCKGTGCFHFKHEYEDFVSREPRYDVAHVVEVDPKIRIGKGESKQRFSDFGGMPYNEWSQGKDFPSGSESRKFTCPAWWYQLADYDKKPDWDECNSNLGGAFSDCEHFPDKQKCWEKFDQ